jgi:3-methyl-2-oxobutanoate hydroxymethyltransferase
MLVAASTPAATRRGDIMTKDLGAAGVAPAVSRAGLTVTDIRARKGVGPPLVMVTAYDAPGAGIASDAGVDIILVGDTVAMVVLGYDNTLAVGVDEMVHHVGAVARARPKPLIVADLPWMSFHLSSSETALNGARLVRAGAQAVKLEGGRKRLPMIEALLDAEIPVMGHLGLTPQSVNAFGGFKVQARTDEAVKRLLDDARALAECGVFALVLEGVPAPVAVEVSAAVAVPTIGIGAGPGCDGQVLVYHDVLGLEDRLRPKFVRRYASLREDSIDALRRYAADVRSGEFPNEAESYGAPKHAGAR